MVAKTHKIQSDDLFYWDSRISSHNFNEFDYDHEEKRSLAHSVNLLLKHKTLSQPKLVQLPSHLVSSPICTCSCSFHLFCTELFSPNEQDLNMLYIHPAPRLHERDISRRISTPFRKSHHKFTEDNDHEILNTSRSEPPPSFQTSTENQFNEKKLSNPTKLPPRTTSLNMPSAYHPLQQAMKNSIQYTPSVRLSRQMFTNPQIQIRSLSVFDKSPSASQIFIPRGPPPSPKTPTRELSTIGFSSPPLRTIPIPPRARQSNVNEKKSTNISSVKITNYEDHAKEYLSASDGSDDDDNDDEKEKEKDEDEKHFDQLLKITKPNQPTRAQSLSRPGTALRDRLLPHTTNRFLNLAEVYYSSFDAYKNLPTKFRRSTRSQTRPATTTRTNENDDAATIITKATTKTVPVVPSQSKSVFGFSKTASSMHFGHAAGRLALQGSFEKWPKPLSRRTPIERKQEVTTLRLVTLPLVTS